MEKLKQPDLKSKLHNGDLIKFVKSPDDKICLDLLDKIKFKDAIYIENSKTKLQEAIEQNLFWERWEIHPQEDLIMQVETILKRDLLNFLKILNKSGSLIIGKNNIIKNNIEGILIQSSCASSGEKLKETDKLQIIECFTRTELGSILGRENIVYILIKKSVETIFKKKYNILLKYRGLAKL